MTEGTAEGIERGDYSRKSVELWLDPQGQVVMCAFDSPKDAELRAGDGNKYVGRVGLDVFQDKKEAEPDRGQTAGAQ